ncbi:MAG: hypothetical protein R3E02_06365 [Blastomonas sp.]
MPGGRPISGGALAYCGERNAAALLIGPLPRHVRPDNSVPISTSAPPLVPRRER